MADATERLQILLDARDNTRGAFASVKGGLASLRDEGERTTGGMSKLGGIVAGMAGGAGFALLTGAVGAVGGAFRSVKGDVIDMNATLETSKVSWGVLLGSSEAAEKQLKTLYSFAATTPFEFPEVEQASRLLQTFGGAALNTEKSLKLVGDIAAGVGQPFADVAMWTGRMYDAIKSGRPFGEAAARLQEMGAMSGETRARLEALQKEGADGAVIWAEFEKSMGRFGGMMDKQSKTFAGLASTLNDTKTQLLATAGASTFAISTRALGGLVALVSDPRAATGAQAISDALGRFYARIGQGFAALRQFADLVRAILGVRGAFDRTALERVTTSMATLRAEFGRAGGDLESAAGGMGTMVGAAGRVARVIDDAARGFQIFADAVVTAREAWRGEWGGGGDESINGFVRVVGNASVVIAAGVERIRDRWLWLMAEIEDKQDRINVVVARWGPRLGAELERAAAAFDLFRLVAANRLDAARGAIEEQHNRILALVARWGPRLRAEYERAGEAFDAFRVVVVERLAPLADLVREKVAPALQFLRENWLKVSLVVGPLIGLLAGLALPLVAITTAVKVLAVAWAQNWGDIRGKTEAVVDWVQGTALPAIAGFWDGIVNAFQRAKDGIAPHWETIKGVFTYLTGGEVTGGLDGLRESFNRYAEDLGRLLGELAGRAAVKLAELAGKFIEWVEPMIPPALEALGRFSARVAEFVATVLLPAAVKALAAFAEEFWKWVGPAIPPLIEKLGVLLERFSVWFVTTALPAIVGQLAKWGLAFADWVATEAIPKMVAKLPDIIDALGTWFVTTAVPFVVTSLADVAKAFGEWVIGAKDWLLRKLPEWINALGTWFTDTALPFVKTSLEGVAKAFGDWVQSAKDWVLDKAAGLPSWAAAVKDWITNDLLPKIPTWLVDAGKQLIQGFIDGIKSRTQDVKNAVTGATNPSAPFQGEVRATEGEPRAAGGPVFAGMKYLVGERGPELFVPRLAGRILSRAETEAAIRAIEDEDRRLVAHSRALRAAGARETSPEVSAIGARLDELDREKMRLTRRLGATPPREILRSAHPPILPSGIVGGQRAGGGDTITIAPGAFPISFPDMQVSNGIGLEAVAQAAQSGVQRGLRQAYAPGRVR